MKIAPKADLGCGIIVVHDQKLASRKEPKADLADKLIQSHVHVRPKDN